MSLSSKTQKNKVWGILLLYFTVGVPDEWDLLVISTGIFWFAWNEQPVEITWQIDYMECPVFFV